jgi:hypothetical protein
MTGGVRSAVGLFGPMTAFDPFGPFGTLTSFGIDVPKGSPGAIADAARVLQTLSGALTEQGKSITGAAQTAAKWQGPAASAYADYSSHVAGVCSANAGACHDAATALQTFSVALATAQSVTTQAAGDFTTAANEMSQHQQIATAAGITAQTARLQAVSEPHPVVQATLQQRATQADREQATAQKAAAAAQAAGEAAQQRGQQALDTYQQDAQALTKQLTAAASHVRQAPALPGAHAAASTTHKGGGSFWSAALPIVGMVVLDAGEEFFSAGLATPAVAAEDAAIMGADAAATGAGAAATAADGAALETDGAGALAKDLTPRGGLKPVRVGQAGEDAVRAEYDIGTKQTISVNGRDRIPDGLTDTTLSEVKNVKSLSFSSQLRDFADYAKAHGLKYDLYVRPTTTFSGPLTQAITDHVIDIEYIP